MNTQENNAHPATLIPALLLALWFFSQAFASAANVTVPGLQLPTIVSYAPPASSIGDKVYANIEFRANAVNGFTQSAKPVIPSSIEFPAAGGRRVIATVTSETANLISFLVPTGAITGSPALLGRDGLRLENQLVFRVVPFTQLTRGVTLINLTQYAAGSVLRGTTELLQPSGTRLLSGYAVFIPMALTVTPTALDIGLVRLTRAGAAVPMFTLREFVGGPVSGTRIAAFRSVLRLERLSVAEALGAMGQSSEWTLFHRGQDRRMTVRSNGTVTLEDRVAGRATVISQYTLVELAWPNNSANLQFTLKDTSGRVGQAIVMHPPFDAFASNQIGTFLNTDTLPFSLGTGEPEGTLVSDPVPLLARRLR